MVFFNKAGKGQNDTLQNRQPCVAGRFYPSDPAELKRELKGYFEEALPKKSENVLAIITPHAGYVYSGQVAATSFNQIDTGKDYEHIFVIGSSHRTYFDGASIYNKGHYITPLGIVEVDLELAQKLIDDHKVFTFNSEAHLQEHSLEVQLPFLQYKMKREFKIVPIVMGTQSVNRIEKVAKALKPYFNERNLFVISSDFSHYPPYEDAVKTDEATATAIATNSPAEFLETIKKNEKKNISNLATSICGWTSVLALLEMTCDMEDVEIIPLQYKNSGDAAFGDKSQVVGYWSMAVVQQKKSEKEGFNLTEEDKKNLLHIARETIENYIRHGEIPVIDTSGFSQTIKTPAGAFVTLHNAGALRGCIGNFTPDKPLYLVVQDMAISAATKDYRFSRVKENELKKIDIEISVLTPMKKIDSVDEIELGKHGIYIKKGWNRGTFLPQVATSTGWDLDEFLGHCARDKAGIGWEGWKDAEVFIYEALVFDEGEFE
jgi:AmmeMemoRadiSam system protein B/AmmeMemoRadiSam system protein A